MLNPFKTIILVQETYLVLVFAISLSRRTSKCNLFETMVLYKRFDVKLICSLCSKIWLSFLCFLIADEINGSFLNRPRPSNGNDGFIFLKIKNGYPYFLWLFWTGSYNVGIFRKVLKSIMQNVKQKSKINFIAVYVGTASNVCRYNPILIN